MNSRKTSSNVTNQKDAISGVGSSWLTYWEKRMVIALKTRAFGIRANCCLN